MYKNYLNRDQVRYHLANKTYQDFRGLGGGKTPDYKTNIVGSIFQDKRALCPQKYINLYYHNEV
jgi:hypothetical protein